MRAFWVGVVIAVLAGCGLSDGGNNGGPHVTVTTVFSGGSPMTYSEPVDWSPDRGWLCFNAAPSDGWKVEAKAGATPVKVTLYSDTTLEGGGYRSKYLGDGRIAYHVNWIGDDRDMHVLAATSDQVENDPAPAVLHHFNGSTVGLVPNSGATPDTFSISADGARAIGDWADRLWLLDWSGADVATTDLGTELDFGGYPALSRDGTRIAYQAQNGKITILTLASGAKSELAAGSAPTWSEDDKKVGYLTNGAYVVQDLDAGTTKSYALPSLPIMHATLSGDATRIAFRTFSGINTGISFGELVD